MKKELSKTSWIYKLVTGTYGSLTSGDFETKRVDSCVLNRAILTAFSFMTFLWTAITVLISVLFYTVGGSIGWAIASIIYGMLIEPEPSSGAFLFLMTMLSITGMIIYLSRNVSNVCDVVSNNVTANDLYKSFKEKYCHQIVLQDGNGKS